MVGLFIEPDKYIKISLAIHTKILNFKSDLKMWMDLTACNHVKKLLKTITIYDEASLHKSKIHLRVHYCKMYFIFYLQKMTYLFTSESVSAGHPDKVADQISDAILDDILEKDPFAHVACEVTASAGLIHVMGEIATSCYVDIQGIARDTVRKIGYNSPVCGFDASSCAVITSISTQSDDIAVGVKRSFELKSKKDSEIKDEIGAGDQGIMYGYACKETGTFMPMPIYLAHKVTKALSTLRETRTLDYLYPDGKAQITVKYKGEDPVGISKIVVSAQHSAAVLTEQIVKDLTKFIINDPKILPQDMLNEKTEVFINPTGRFVIGGPVADTGLTGRKIMVDTYGGEVLQDQSLYMWIALVHLIIPIKN